MVVRLEPLIRNTYSLGKYGIIQARREAAQALREHNIVEDTKDEASTPQASGTTGPSAKTLRRRLRARRAKARAAGGLKDYSPMEGIIGSLDASMTNSGPASAPSIRRTWDHRPRSILLQEGRDPTTYNTPPASRPTTPASSPLRQKSFSQIHTAALSLLAQKSQSTTYTPTHFIQWQEQIRLESFIYTQDQRTKAQLEIRDNVLKMIEKMGGLEAMTMEQRKISVKYLRFFEGLFEMGRELRGQLGAFLERHTPIEQQGVVAEYMEKELAEQSADEER